MNQMLGDTVEAALNKMMMTNQHQHSDGLLQEFYVMTQRAHEPIDKYAVSQPGSQQGKIAVQGGSGQQWRRKGKVADQLPSLKHEP